MRRPIGAILPACHRIRVNLRLSAVLLEFASFPGSDRCYAGRIGKPFVAEFAV